MYTIGQLLPKLKILVLSRSSISVITYAGLSRTLVPLWVPSLCFESGGMPCNLSGSLAVLHRKLSRVSVLLKVPKRD